MAAKKRSSNFFRFSLIKVFLFFVLLIGIYLIWAYLQNLSLTNQGNQLLSEGKTADAIALLTKARQIFPFNPDTINSLQGALLVQLSTMDYGAVYEIQGEIENAELQNVPSLSSLPSVALKPGEVFVPMLMYHHIWLNPRPKDPLWASLSVTPDQLDSQFNYLSTHNYHPVTLTELFDSFEGKFSLPQNPIILSFDDGYKNFYTDAFPLLKKYNFVAEEFVITSVTTYPAYLTWDQISELDKSGLVEIGAHTQHHPDLTAVPSKMLTSEVFGCKSDIESHLHKTVNFFAYPYGSYNDNVIKAVKDAGFRGATSTIYGSNQSSAKSYLLPRIMVDGRFSISEFAKRIAQ